MLAERAYCFCQLHPAFQEMRESKSRKAMVFLDPCAGFGSIPLELSGVSKRDSLNIINLAADNELPSLEKALENAVAAHAGVKKGLSGMDASLLWTGYGTGHSGGFREGVLDGIIADLPWGIRELSAKAISTLYPALLRFLGHATANGAYGIFLCWREKTFLAAVRSNDRMWEVTDHRVSLFFSAHEVYLRDKSDYVMTISDCGCGRCRCACFHLEEEAACSKPRIIVIEY
jgi:hypothetical protein